MKTTATCSSSSVRSTRSTTHISREQRENTLRSPSFFFSSGPFPSSLAPLTKKCLDKASRSSVWPQNGEKGPTSGAHFTSLWRLKQTSLPFFHLAWDGVLPLGHGGPEKQRKRKRERWKKGSSKPILGTLFLFPVRSLVVLRPKSQLYFIKASVDVLLLLLVFRLASKSPTLPPGLEDTLCKKVGACLVVGSVPHCWWNWGPEEVKEGGCLTSQCLHWVSIGKKKFNSECSILKLEHWWWEPPALKGTWTGTLNFSSEQGRLWKEQSKITNC